MLTHFNRRVYILVRLQSERGVEDFVYDPLLHITALYATHTLYIFLHTFRLHSVIQRQLRLQDRHKQNLFPTVALSILALSKM